MEERQIVDVTPIEETDWPNDTECMSGKSNMSEFCSSEAAEELTLEYDDEPDKTFYTVLCEPCAKEYKRKLDKAQIYGDDEVLD